MWIISPVLLVLLVTAFMLVLFVLFLLLLMPIITMAVVTLVLMAFLPGSIVLEFESMTPVVVQANMCRQSIHHDPAMTMMVVVINMTVYVVVDIMFRVVEIFKTYAD